MTDSERRFRRDPRVAYRELGGEAGGVLLHLDTGAYYSVNRTGALIWSLAEPTFRFRDLVARVRARLSDAPATLEDDVAAFVEDLSARGLMWPDEP